MVSAIEQLVLASQEQHRRYLELFATNPVSGDGLRDLASHIRTVSQIAQGIRREVIGLDFSTEVIAPYTAATEPDHLPLDKAAAVFEVAASVADTSTQINVDGARAIASNAQSETSQVSAVADPESPAGTAAIVAIIERHQAEAAAIVQKSSLGEQIAGQRAVAAGGDTGNGSSRPSIQSETDNESAPSIQMVSSEGAGVSPVPTIGDPNTAKAIDESTGPAIPKSIIGTPPRLI